MKRRDFNKLMAAAVAGLLAGGCAPTQEEETKTPSSPSGSPMACSANGCSANGCSGKKTN